MNIAKITRAVFLMGMLALANHALAQETTTYIYDSLGRLTKVSISGSASDGTSADYSYDAAGNRTNVKVVVPSSSSVIVASGYNSSSTWNNYTGLSGNGAGMRDAAYTGSSSVHGTDGSDAAPFIVMDLGSARQVTGIVVAPISSSFQGWGAGYLNGAALHHSLDGTSWTPLATVTGTVEGYASTINVSMTTRYIRLSKSSTWLGVSEFYALGPNSSSPPPPTAGGTITPQSYSSSSNFNNYTALSGTGSGMRDTVYTGAGSMHGTAGNDNSPWIMMDLGSQKSVATVVVGAVSGNFDGWNAGYLSGAQLEVSLNGTSWTAVTTIVGAVDGVNMTVNVNQSVRYIRLHRVNQPWLAAAEFYATQ